MRTTLKVFDFDGTLVHTPEELNGRAVYEAATGKSWVIETDEQALQHGFDKGFRRRGWWGRVETLFPPIVERPATGILHRDVHAAWLSGDSDPNCHMVLITGRHLKLKPHVEGVLTELGITLHDHFYKGMPPWCKHPEYKDDTPNWKMFAIREAAMNPQYKILEIYEDREDVIELFKTKLVEDLKVRWPQLTYVGIHDAKYGKAYHFPLKPGESYSFLRQKAVEKMEERQQ